MSCETKKDRGVDNCVCDCHALTCSLNLKTLKSSLLDDDSRVTFDNKLIQSFDLCATYHDSLNLTECIDWDQSGDCLLSCCRNSTIILHSLSRESSRHLYSQKYGAYGGRFMHKGPAHCIVAAKTPLHKKSITVSTLLTSLSRCPWKISRSTESYREKFGKSLVEESQTLDNTEGSLRYWDLRENRFVSTFPLRSAVSPQVQLSVSQPPIELICASCLDGSVRFYRHDRPKPLAVVQTGMPFHAYSCVAHQGYLAAIQIEPFTIQLLDLRKNWTRADYMSIDLNVSLSSCSEISLKDYCIANLQLVEASGYSVFVTLLDRYCRPTLLQYDAHTGHLLHIFFTPRLNPKESYIERWKLNESNCTLSSQALLQFNSHVSCDGAYIACVNNSKGSGYESILAIWSTRQCGLPIKILPTGSRIASQVQWNPTRALLASSYDHLAFWGPNTDIEF